MRFRPLLILLAIAGLLLFAAGCGDDDDEDATTPATTPEAATGATGAGGAAGATSVSMTEFAFDPSDLTVSEGDSIDVTNDGGTDHNLTVEDEDLATSDLGPGDSEELTVDIPAGDYTFICTIGDHEAQGMTGTLTVE